MRFSKTTLFALLKNIFFLGLFLLASCGISFAEWGGKGGGYLECDVRWIGFAALLLVGAVYFTRKQVSDLKQRAGALQAYEKHLLTLADRLNVVLWECDNKGYQFSYVSDPGQCLLGFSLEEWKARGFWERQLHIDDKDRVLQFLKSREQSMDVIECEYRLIDKDGQVVFVRDLRSHTLGKDGRKGCMRGVLINWSVHKESEALLENSELRFRSIFEQAAVGTALCDPSGKFVRVNQRYCQISGYSESELLERDFRAITHVDDVEIHERLIDQLLISDRQEKVLFVEKRLVRGDKKIVFVRVTMSIVRSRDQSVGQLMEVIEDITARKQAEAELRESEGRMRSVLSTMRDAVVMRDAKGQVIVVNEAARKAFQEIGSSEIMPLNGSELYQYLNEDGSICPPDQTPSRRAMVTGEAHSAVLGVEQYGKVRGWVLVHAQPLEQDPTTGLHPVVVTWSDISEQRMAEEQLRLAATVFDNSIEAIMIMDVDKRILSVNSAFIRLTQFSSAQVLGARPDFMDSGKHDRAFYDGIWDEAAVKGYWSGELWQRRQDGSEFIEQLTLSTVHSNKGAVSHYVAVFSDISQRKASEERIAFLAHHDPLTELPNRALLQEWLTTVLEKAAQAQSHVALMFLDLDRFKTINDSLGHTAGDLLLKAVGKRLKDCVGADGQVFRQGGDEFMVVVPDLPHPQFPEEMARRILAHLSVPFEIGEHILGTSFSIGIALFPADGHDFGVLMKNADTAMYYAKENGRNTYQLFAQAMNANALERLEVENLLRRALERDELLLYYQPQIDLSSGKVTGAEALIRWQSDALGFVPPARFVSIAEESGLIVPIGRWVLDQACLHAKQWQDQGLPPAVVAVNISALQFSRDDIVNSVRDSLESSGLEAKWLELELTESLLMQNVELVQETMVRLKALGVRLTIDDFGTGYSSLSYLKQFAVDRLKIDKSFVRDVAEDPEDAAIVRAILQLGKGLKLDVIAEGAEGEDQTLFLIQEGCREAQGYYFCSPLNNADFQEVLREGINWDRPDMARVVSVLKGKE